MKKICLLFLFLTACSVAPNYQYKIDSMIDKAQGKTIEIRPIEKGVLSTKMKFFFREKLENEGFIVVNDKANYLFIYGKDNKRWQTMRTVPTFGQTGINSVSSYGRVSTFGNTAYGQSTSYVNYNYGINGYQNVIDDHYLKTYAIAIMDNKTRDIVYEATFSTSLEETDEDFVSYFKEIFNRYPILNSSELFFNCYMNDSRPVCENLY